MTSEQLYTYTTHTTCSSFAEARETHTPNTNLMDLARAFDILLKTISGVTLTQYKQINSPYIQRDINSTTGRKT
jgi:hypothetical protein